MAVSFGGPPVVVGGNKNAEMLAFAQQIGQLRDQRSQRKLQEEQNRQARIQNAYTALQAGGAARTGWHKALQENEPIARQLWSDLTGQKEGLWGKLTGKAWDEAAYQQWRNKPDSIDQMIRASAEKQYQELASQDIYTQGQVIQREEKPSAAQIGEGKAANILGSIVPMEVPAMGLQERNRMIDAQRGQITKEVATEYGVSPEFIQRLPELVRKWDEIEKNAEIYARQGDRFDYQVNKNKFLINSARGLRVNLNQIEQGKEILNQINSRTNEYASSIPFEDGKKFDLQSMIDGLQKDKSLSDTTRPMAIEIATIKNNIFNNKKRMESAGGDAGVAGKLDAIIKADEKRLEEKIEAFKSQVQAEVTPEEIANTPGVIREERIQGRKLTEQEKWDMFWQSKDPASKAIISKEGFAAEIDAWQKQINQTMSDIQSGKGTMEDVNQVAKSVRQRVFDTMADKTEKDDFLEREARLSDSFMRADPNGFWKFFRSKGAERREQEKNWEKLVREDEDVARDLREYATAIELAGGKLLTTANGIKVPFPAGETSLSEAGLDAAMRPEDLQHMANLESRMGL